MKINLPVKKLWLSLLFLSLSILFWGFRGFPVFVQAFQQEAGEGCDTVQVIVIVDQSSSMLSTDPNQLRYDGPLHLADILAKHQILAYQRTQNQDNFKPLKIEFAVVYFASGAKIQMPWTMINPESDEAWSDQRKILEPKLVLTRDDYLVLVEEIGNATHFVRAFNKVEELLLQKGVQEGSCPGRLVMLLTDGAPEIPDPIYGQALEDHMTEVGWIVNRIFPVNGNLIYVTGIDTGEEYWQRTEKYWQDIARDSESQDPRRVELANTFGELGFRLALIVQRFLGTDTTPPPPIGAFVVPPYVDRLTLTFYKAERDDIIELFDSEGLLDENRSDVEVNVIGQDGAIQSIEILRPMPGRYRLTTTAESDEYVISYQLVFVNTRFSSTQTTLQQFTTSNIEIEMIDSRGLPLSHYNNLKYALRPKATMRSDHFEFPVTMSHLDSGILQGNFTPFESGNHLLSVEASAYDDDGQEISIIEPPDADFDLVVDPITFKIGKPVSPIQGCAPTQHSYFEIPIQLVNARTEQPTQISVPITWDFQTNQDANVTVTGPDHAETYLIKVESREAGDLELKIRASAPNPLDAQLHLFFEDMITVSVEDSRLFSFEIVDLQTQARGIDLIIEQFLDKIIRNPETDTLLIGRKWFFIPQDVLITARLIDEESGKVVVQGDLFPDIHLETLGKGPTKIISGAGWQENGTTELTNTFNDLELGRYRINLTSETLSCNVTLHSSSAVNETLRLIPDFLERMIIAILVIACLTLLYYLIVFILCRTRNKLHGYLVIVNNEGRRLWFNAVNGRSCWKFKIDNPNKYCSLIKIQIRGCLSRKGQFLVKVTRFDPQKRKKITDKHYRNLHAWHDISLPGGCRIKHVRTQAEVPPI